MKLKKIILRLLLVFLCVFFVQMTSVSEASLVTTSCPSGTFGCHGSCILDGSLCCPKDEQPCNGRCILDTDLCILEPFPPLPGQPVVDTIPAGMIGFGTFEYYLNTAGVWRWAFRMGVAIAVLNGVIGGLQITMSNGDSSKVDAGKIRFISSAIGLMILFLAGVILNFINPLGFTS